MFALERLQQDLPGGRSVYVYLLRQCLGLHLHSCSGTVQNLWDCILSTLLKRFNVYRYTGRRAFLPGTSASRQGQIGAHSFAHIRDLQCFVQITVHNSTPSRGGKPRRNVGGHRTKDSQTRPTRASRRVCPSSRDRSNAFWNYS